MKQIKLLEKSKWTVDELLALCSTMHAMALVDGREDSQELAKQVDCLMDKPGFSEIDKHFIDSKEFIDAALEKSKESNFEVLSGLSPEKKRVVMVDLFELAVVDGKVDVDELKFVESMRQVLGV